MSMASHQIRLQEADLNTIVPLVGKGIVKLVTKHYIVSSLWVMGLIVLSCFQGLVVPKDRMGRYEQIMGSVDYRRLASAQEAYWAYEDTYKRTKGWFSCDSTCQVHRRRMMESKGRLDRIAKEQEAVRRDANAQLGVFSTYGVEETKGLFWRSFSWAKQFGRRQTFWDMIFMGLRSMRRDETLVEYILSIVFHFLINMSMGMVTALFSFIFSLWTLIRSYQPDLLTGLAFFFGAAVSAAAMVATYLTLLYGATIGTVAVGFKMISNANRLEGPGGRRYHLHQR